MIALSRQLDRLDQMLDIYREQSVEQLDAKKSAMALQITNLENQTKKWGEQNLELSRKSAAIRALEGQRPAHSVPLRLVAGHAGNAGRQQGHQPGKRHHLPTRQRRVSRTRRWSRKAC